MIKLTNFKVYIPKDGSKEDLISLGVTFLVSDEGVDWYESQSTFSKDTIKVVCDADNKIVSKAKDVSSLWPIDKSVFEFNEKDIPENLTLTDDWIVNSATGKIEQKTYTQEELSEQVNSEMKSKISEILSIISPLQFALDLEMATEEEKQKLKSLQKYVVLLNRVPLQDSYPTGVNWPEIPTT